MNWYSIYHKEAIKKLYDNNILVPAHNHSCNDIESLLQNHPIWHPELSLKHRSYLIKCHPSSITGGKTPFDWTTVAPDCFDVGASRKICLKRPKKI